MAGSDTDTVELPGLENPEEAYKWIKERGMLLEKRVCQSCFQPLVLGPSENFFESFKCHNDQCERRNAEEISIFKDSFFSPRSNVLTLPNYIHLIKYWCDGTEPSTASKKLKISQSVVRKVYKKCREFCSKVLKMKPVQLGGSLIDVAAKIYDVRFKIPKSSDGVIWILMMVCKISYEPEWNGGYMQVVNEEHSDNPALILIMEKVAVSGSYLICDHFGNPPKASSNLRIQNCNEDHKTMLSTYYNKQNDVIKKIKRVGDEAEFYLKERMWKERANGDVFAKFLKDFKTYYYSED